MNIINIDIYIYIYIYIHIYTYKYTYIYICIIESVMLLCAKARGEPGGTPGCQRRGGASLVEMTKVGHGGTGPDWDFSRNMVDSYGYLDTI